MSAVRSRTGAVTGNTNKKSTRFLPRLNPNFSNNSQWAKNNLPILKKNIIREKTPQIVIALFIGVYVGENALVLIKSYMTYKWLKCIHSHKSE